MQHCECEVMEMNAKAGQCWRKLTDQQPGSNNSVKTITNTHSVKEVNRRKSLSKSCQARRKIS